MLKYVLYTGSVFSKTDGDLHLITSSHLAYCYGVSLKECAVIHYTMKGRDREQAERLAGELKLIPLEPRYHGDYKEHLAELLAERGGTT